MKESVTSLSEVHRTVKIPLGVRSWKKIAAFFGPAYLISVGYMDPGNWATDMEGGSRFGYQLIWVLVMSNLMAVLLQTLSARLGIVSGQDLAQACRDSYPRPIALALWVLAEVAIAACDLAEVIGTAIGLNLLFGFPLIWGVLITGADSLLLLGIQNLGIRTFEAFILALVITIGGCFIFELFLSKPDIGLIAGGFVPHLPDGALLVVTGIIGATVMPHNLYLHSALVQTRAFDTSEAGKKLACKYNFWDSMIALNGAFFVNAAILILAAAVFFKNGLEVTELQQAHTLISPLLGTSLAGIVFAIALLAAGQSSTLTGTLAGQIIMEGFLNFKIRPQLRRLITRLLAIIPAVIVILTSGAEGSYKLLILSQVILSLQLSFAIIPLIRFTNSRERMGDFANKLWVKIISWIITTIILSLNIWLVIESFREWIASTDSPFIVYLFVFSLAITLLVLLGYVCFKPLGNLTTVKTTVKEHIGKYFGSVEKSLSLELPVYKKIGVAIDFSESDKNVLSHAVSLATHHKAELWIFHIVEGASGIVLGSQAYGEEAREDAEYLENIAASLMASDITAKSVLGFGSVPKEIVRLAKSSEIDVLVMGAHGHRGFFDFFYGTTISPVRHLLKIPIVIIR
ncbi:MAG: Nramp family divalent metal transporter [Bacteroidetes bacterium]|nr:Nramp family divalent metal transporter [Bacteroidota bacterium]